VRLGFDEKNHIDIAKIVEDSGADFIAVHGRTRAGKFKAEVDYDAIKEIKEAISIPVIANGDIDSYEKAQWVLEHTGADGLMIGRGAVGAPWIFHQLKSATAEIDPMIKHQMVSGKIFSELDNKICEKCIAVIEIDYRVSDDTVVSPDVLVACGDDLGEKYLRKTPEIVFEILSPSTAKRDRGIKYQLYEGQAIKYYVIVNSQMKTAEVYRLVEGRFILDKNVSDDEYRFKIDSCEIDFVFKNIWA
jgi:tRNA-dihydrouridine synthase